MLLFGSDRRMLCQSIFMIIGLKVVICLRSFSFHIVACFNRSEQALECEEAAVATVSTAGPSNEAAAPGIVKFLCLVCTYLQRMVL